MTLPLALIGAALSWLAPPLSAERPVTCAELTPGSAGDPSLHRTRCVAIRPGVSLEVLDWGGPGQPLVFLAGLGDTGHEFDDFAPRFTDGFHVLAITRRGYGQSSRTEDGYDLSTLAEDLRITLDSLGLERVTLIGHSFGGDEMSNFAARWPSRVQRLIYLDAAHDRTALRGLLASVPMPPDPPMTSADSASPEAVRDYVSRASYGVTLPLSWVTSTMRFDATGHLIGPATPDSMFPIFLAGTLAPEYRRIQAPALAIYAVPEAARDLFPAYAGMSPADQAKADTATARFRIYIEAQIATVRRELRGARVLIIPRARHYVFISNEQEVERAVRQFLTAAP
jgi:pimeloyl-ACP methyl ester carboxylesterase